MCMQEQQVGSEKGSLTPPIRMPGTQEWVHMVSLIQRLGRYSKTSRAGDRTIQLMVQILLAITTAVLTRRLRAQM